MDPEEKIKFVLKNLIATKKLLKSDSYTIKLTGDGCSLTRAHRNLLYFAFSIIEDENCKTATNHFMLGIFQIKKENYETLSEALKDLISKCSSIEDQFYEIKFKLGADLKFLAIVYGINAAISN